MSNAPVLFPPLLWAQRSEYILLTVALQDATDVQIELNEEGTVLTFACRTPDETCYACKLELYGAIAAEESSNVVRPRQIEMKLKKKKKKRKMLMTTTPTTMTNRNSSKSESDKLHVEEQNENNQCVIGSNDKCSETEDEEAIITWPRLTREKMKSSQIQIDWNKWRDDDNDEMNADDTDDLGDFGINEDNLYNFNSHEDDDDGDDDENGENNPQNSSLLNKFLQAQAKREAAERAGISEDKLPDFGSAKGQLPMTEDEIAKGEAKEAAMMDDISAINNNDNKSNNNNNIDKDKDDDDDVPAFEEEDVL